MRQATLAAVEADPDGWPFPLVVKPRFGSAGIGVAIVHDELELAWRRGGGEVVVQTVAAGVEHTIDALVDRAGRCVCAVPRRRIEVRAGEVSKARDRALAGARARPRPTCAQPLPGAYGAITIQAFLDETADELAVIELNARFGGGYPLGARGRGRLPPLDARGAHRSAVDGDRRRLAGRRW